MPNGVGFVTEAPSTVWSCRKFRQPLESILKSVYYTFLWVTTSGTSESCWYRKCQPPGSHMQAKTNTRNYLERLFIQGPLNVHTVLETWLDWQQYSEAPNMAWMRHRLLGEIPWSSHMFSHLQYFVVPCDFKHTHSHSQTHKNLGTWVHALMQRADSPEKHRVYRACCRSLISRYLAMLAALYGI